MTLAKTLLKLWRLRLWVGIGVLVGGVAAVSSVALSHSTVYATASTQMLVDSPDSALANASVLLDGYVARRGRLRPTDDKRRGTPVHREDRWDQRQPHRGHRTHRNQRLAGGDPRSGRNRRTARISRPGRSTSSPSCRTLPCRLWMCTQALPRPRRRSRSRMAP